MTIAALISDLVKAGTDAELIGRVAEALASRDAVVVRDDQAELHAAGVTGDALVTAVARIEAAMKPVRTANAERQARYRDRVKERNEALHNVTDNAKKEIPPTPPKEKYNITPETAKAVSSPVRRVAGKRSRISETWQPGEIERAFAANRGMPAAEIPRQAEKFRNYHSGRGSLMADWSAAWRTWCGNWRDFQPGRAQEHASAVNVIPNAESLPGKIFIAADTEQWHAWAAHRGRSPPQQDCRTENKIQRGWFFDSEWPPGHLRVKGASDAAGNQQPETDIFKKGAC